MLRPMTGSHPWVEGGTIPRLGANLTPSLPWPQLRAQARRLEAAGFDGVFSPDHPLLFSDPWPVMAALAEATEKVRLGTVVSCVSYRHPVTLARLAADVDRISDGRVVLGIGSGDMPWEFHRMGLKYGTGRQRRARLAEALTIIERLLAGETVTFAGDFYRVHEVALDPPPAHTIPMLIAGGGPGTLRLVARHGHASNIGAASWAGGAFTPGDTAARWSTLRAACDEAGRDFNSVLRTGLINLKVSATQQQAQAKVDAMPPQFRNFFEQLVVPCTPESAVGHVQRLLDEGYQYVIFQGLDPETLEHLVASVLPQFRTAVRATG
jgi:alkanesulfonate monooxygenase SsuD/methylene tetrahydromethanopterin reductase-like flavin-dependent oxidoreductase (luciferase family)